MEKATLFIRIILIAAFMYHPINSTAQLSRQLLDMIPDSCKPVPLDKKVLTTKEKIDVLNYAATNPARSKVLKELDSIASELEKDTVSSDIKKNVMIENKLHTYAARTGEDARALTFCDHLLNMLQGKKEYTSVKGKWQGTKGLILSRLGRYEESIKYLYTVLEEARANKDSLAIAAIYYGLSSPEFFLEFPEKVVDVLDSSRAYFAKNAMGKEEFESYYGKYVISFQYLGYLLMYEKTDSSKYVDKMNELATYANENNLPALLIETFPAINAYAEVEYAKAILICDSILAGSDIKAVDAIYQYKIIILQKYKALSLYKLGQMPEAITEMKKCIQTCQDFDKIDTVRGFTKYTVEKLSYLLYKYYSQTNDWQEAYYFLSLNSETREKIDLLRNRGKAFEAEQKYNLTKADEKIDQLAIDDLLRKKEKNIAIAITIASLLSFIIIVLLLINRNRKLQLKKQLAEHDAQNRIEKLNMASQMQIAELEEKAQMIKMEERKRLGRELHDDLAGTLAAIRMQVSVEALKIKDEELHNKFGSIAEQLSNAYNITRSKSHEWYIGQNDDPSFSKRIKIMIENVLPGNMYKKEITIEDGALDKIDIKAKINILRIIQETITNILKHANAKKVSLLIYEEIKGIYLKISDDGKGFNYQPGMKTGVGLRSIKERVEELEGDMEIVSKSNGTEITIIIPATIESAIIDQ